MTIYILIVSILKHNVGEKMSKRINITITKTPTGTIIERKLFGFDNFLEVIGTLELIKSDLEKLRVESETHNTIQLDKPFLRIKEPKDNDN